MAMWLTHWRERASWLERTIHMKISLELLNRQSPFTQTLLPPQFWKLIPRSLRLLSLRPESSPDMGRKRQASAAVEETPPPETTMLDPCPYSLLVQGEW